MTDSANDDALKALYRQSRREQPSEQIDARIRLAAAAPFRRRQKRWIWGLSMAAVIVLSFSLLLEVLILPPPATINGDSSFEEGDKETRERIVPRLSVPQPLEVAPAPMYKKQLSETPRETLDADQAVIARKQRPAPATMEAGSALPEAELMIPLLPLQLDRLLPLDKALTGKQSPDGVIELYRQHRLILQILPQDDGYQLQAFPGAEILGVRVDWLLQPVDLEACDVGPAGGDCRINDQVIANFKHNRLESIRWSVSDD